MDIWGMVWVTGLLVGVLLAFAVMIWYVRSAYRDNSIEKYSIDMEKMAQYIQDAKDKENKAWNYALSVMPDETEGLSTYLAANPTNTANAAMKNTQAPMSQVPGKRRTGSSPRTMSSTSSSRMQNAPPTLMQQAFFNFWKIPVRSRPITANGANGFIEKYKASLKAEGLAHRVHRWNRLELVMGRFCSDYDVVKLNAAGFNAGLNKPVLDIMLDIAIQLLSKKELSWKELTKEESYKAILKYINASYPQLRLHSYKR